MMTWDLVSGPKMLENIGLVEAGNAEGVNQCCHQVVVKACCKKILRSKQVYKVMNQSS